MSDALNAELVDQQLIAAWSREGLRPFPVEVLDKIALSETAHKLLADYGLPAFWGGPPRTDVETVLLGGMLFWRASPSAGCKGGGRCQKVP